ncbi:OmpA family protein [Campylobacter sp. 19-13652]|uniref:OmpA family protein n=1 Tax=Campylobacter sp. 19-13652 TaxID=2840180 RepID=UPI001C73E3B8|nr:OmpA family protein [Campylobacter sp. 19-13652]BCX80085.1 outer membrane protein A [Campylobacter sp. 19-13652]
MKKIALALVASTALFAGEAAYNYEITPTISGVHAEGNLGINNENVSVGIRAARNLENFFLDQVELGFDYAPSVKETQNRETRKGRVNRYYVNGVKNLFDITDKVGVYGLIGVGYEDVPKAFVKNEDGGFGQYGAGVRYQITDQFALKAEVRDEIKFEHADHNLFYTLGFAFGLDKKATPVVAATPVVVVEETVVVLDDDNDGVLNDADKCPNTPAGVVVDETGCEKKIVLKDVNFAFDSYKVSENYVQRIKEVADFMKVNPAYSVILSGYTDSVGSEAYNLKLSQKRANAVKEVLVKDGVESEKITTVGYGEANPVATNKTKEGRAENRRVEATFKK